MILTLNNKTAMKNPRALNALIVAVIIVVAWSYELMAQSFSVESFRVLPNDVSAFINPVRDLNDEDCGLIKVMVPEDFAFSTPLGIVKREDNIGEIWLYVPRGTKKITIKHPQWGVLRDYNLPTKVDSHITYEMRLELPESHIVKVENPVITTVVDTVVMTRVDTLVIAPERKRIPFSFDAQATICIGVKSSNVLGGIRLFAFKRHGGFMHCATDFGKIGRTSGECGKDGDINGSAPFYSGKTRKSAFMINAGAVHRLSNRVAIFEGLGYGSTSLAWQLAQSEGGSYVKNSYYSRSGISAEAGVLLTFNRITLSASVATIKTKDWFGSVGVGIRLGK